MENGTMETTDSCVLEVKFRLALTDQLPVLSVSGNVEEVLGFGPEDFLAGRLSLKDLIHPDDLDIAETLFFPLQETSGRCNLRLRQANGRIRCIRGLYQKRPEENGSDVTLDLLVQDAKSLKRTLDDVVSMANFRAMMEITDDYIYFKDRNHVFTGASQTLVSLCDPAEHWTDLIGKTDYDVFPEEYADIYYRLEKQVFAGVAVAQEIQETLTKDGKKGWVDNRKYPIHNGNGECIGLYGIARDITERKLTEQALRESEERFRALSDASYGGIIIHDKGLILECNKGLSDMTGYGHQELIGMDGLRLIAPESLDTVIHNIQRGYEEGYEVKGVRKDGTQYPLAIKGRNISYKGCLARVIEFRDITERKRAEEALRQSEDKFRSIIELSPSAMHFYRLDPDGSLIFTGANPSADRIFGISHLTLVNKPIEDAFPNLKGTDIPDIFRNVAKGVLGHQSFEVTYKDDNINGVYDVQVYRTNPENIVVDFMDISDRKRAEEERIKLEKQLLHAQKLESLGVLAGGIAHDFNNILTTIIGNAELALIRLNPESAAIDNLQRIENAAIRAADLAKQMLAYSGKGMFVIESIDLNRLVEEMGHMLEVSISKKAILRYNLTRSLPAINVDSTQIRQIIMNLVINASEAIGDKSGVIAITTGCQECTEAYLKDVWLTDAITEGLYVFLEISDTGCGMDKETLTKLFDPFFTTKFTGRGLGMAAVLGIIRGHKGAIKIYSEPGKGSSFKVLLPAGERPAELFNGDETGDPWKGSGVVLLVDDEESVRAIGAEMLRELGFEVITARDGQEAVDAFTSHQDIGVVLLDLTMPHMDGEQCFRELRHLKPDVQVILSSGFSEHEVTQKFIGKGLAGFIQKPYKLSELKEAFRRIETR